MFKNENSTFRTNVINKLIKDDYIGLKTGWTNEAGLTFIGLNQTNNRNILTIVNKSIVNENKDNHFIDTKILYKESIENFDKISIIDKDQDINIEYINLKGF